MVITKILYNEEVCLKALAVCDIVFDDSLKVVGVRLYKNSTGYYLVFPSKQDIYQNVQQVNAGVSVVLPEVSESKRKKEYEEFFYPMNSAFYGEILNEVVSGYELNKNKGIKCYIPRNEG